jgi:DNA-binding Lrp family transcriptional regulator
MSHIAALTNRNHDVVSLSKKISASPQKISKIIKILEKNKILKRYI